MNGQKLFAALLALTLCAAALTGCGGGGSATVNAPSKTKSDQLSANATTVSNMEELLEAVAPGAEIVIAPGYYNMTDYINDLWLMDEGASFNAQHEYVEIRDCYDGAEAVIKGADGVSISGGGSTAETEIVIEPRYGIVLTFQRCDNVKLSNLTLGHTDTGECSGSVVNLSACRNAELRNLDLYGCGVTALECSNGTENVFVHDSALRDCSWGPLDVYDAVGKIELRDCTLTGSGGGGSYNSESRLELGFYNCVFGPNETNYWAFVEGIETDDCVWSEITQYPDYEEDQFQDGYDDYDYEPPTMPDNPQEVTFDIEEYGDSGWLGYQLVNPDTGEAVSLPSGADVSAVYLSLNSYGMGALTSYYEKPLPFLWEQSGAAELSLWTRNDGTLSITSYRDADADDAPVWLALRTPEGVLWMY